MIMFALAIQSIFYGKILPDSIAAGVFVLLILIFRQATKRWSKGYVRLLWILLLAGLLAPPFAHGSFYTLRNLGMDVQGMKQGVRQTQAHGQAESVGQYSQQGAQATGRTGQAGGPGEQDLWSTGQAEGPGEQDLWRVGQAALRDTRALDGTGQYVQPEAGRIDWRGMQGLWRVGQAGGPGEQDLWSTGQAALRDTRALDGTEQYVQADASSKSSSKSCRIRLWCARLWLAGAALVFIYDICRYLLLRKKLKDAHKVAGQGYWVCAAAKVPFVLPGIAPRIYLPPDIGGAQKNGVLAHEKQHIKNFDPLIKIFSAAILVFYWFQPLLWIAVFIMGKDMEMYCDECVLRGKGLAERKAYSGMLLQYAAKNSGLSFTMHFGEGDTGKRIHHILYMKRPRLPVAVLLIGWIGISGALFLTSQEAAAQKQGQESGALVEKEEIEEKETKEAKEAKAGLEDFRNDPRQFAKEVIRLVKNGQKRKLAKYIQFPVRAKIDGDETYLINAQEFVDLYEKIATAGWKKSMLETDVDQIDSHDTGCRIGDGVWYSQVLGHDGYWIYTLCDWRNPADDENSVESQKAWRLLAQANGVPEQEARRWYVQFIRDELSVGKGNMRVTGCAYEDFDKNGEKDLFLVVSQDRQKAGSDAGTNFNLDTEDLGTEDLGTEDLGTEDFATHVYGYLNGELEYIHDFDFDSGSVSQNGFLQCEAQESTQDGISFEIRYTIDAGRQKEQTYLLAFDTHGRLAEQTIPGKSEAFIRKLSQIPRGAYERAVSCEKFLEKLRGSEARSLHGEQLVTLYENAKKDLYVYGYIEKDLASYGTIVYEKGVYSFLDVDVLGSYYYAAPSVHVFDADADTEDELVCTYHFGHGTGVSTWGLVVLDKQKDGAYKGYELKRYNMEQQVEKLVHFDRRRGKVEVGKVGAVEKTIDLTKSPEYEIYKDTIEINCTNVYEYKATGGRITLQMDLLAQIGPLWYMDGLDNCRTKFAVSFQNGKFRITTGS